MATQHIPISAPSVGEQEWLALREPLESGWLTQGPKVAEFERAFAVRHQVKHAIASSSCTTALHLVLAALEIGPGDEVIVPAFTWVATANAVLYVGATPVFVDVDPQTSNLDPAQLSRCLTPRTKAILPVHLFGRCAEMDAIAEIAADIPLIEDAACAAGASYRGRPAGSLGLAGCFSFHPRKTITTGEGGMVTTDDDCLAETIVMLRNHGASVPEEVRHDGPRPYVLPEFDTMGFNYRMTDLQGVLGCVQLAKLDDLLEERQVMANFYSRELRDIPWLRTPAMPPAGSRHGWQSYVCFVDESLAPCTRNQMMSRLQEQGVSTRPGTHAVVALGLFKKKFGCRPEEFPGAWDCDRYTMAIPLHNKMTLEDARCVVEALVRMGT